mmetsp:Transcript_15473/g.24275  ORF Transcript_15473/g.24275 Transcript_15473/m.24275 type:complete len:273 (-) Transcript_15473:172-990(-)|eukprot:CAMPEP_0117011038 /NCGR_PEP_ID=MMETSP0472-20121206/9575_1 /TAXON_ID=693140 ORGANISM="Tiarina fusus, Strain LIS" /NCGR_SAMPLE_ID=MMETSP0472 /ASSEMBLY_ACC=CAM_ASM_000603 /LENGTH=272 /DNA_ID=CAMNT_0004713721 /DNA_START=149 /DNA_END=967 /DNA_ORIENTATION=+
MNYGSTTEEGTILPNGGAATATSPEQQAETEKKLRRWGLSTGLLYVVIIVCGIVAEVGIRGKVIDFSSIEQTAENIRSNPKSLRYSLMLDVIMGCSDVFVSILLGFILVTAGVDPILSIASSGFRYLQQAVIACCLMFLFAASMLLDENMDAIIGVGTAIESLSSGEQGVDAAESLAFFFLAMHKYGYLLALFFFGVSLFILGLLIVQRGVFPKFFGWAILLAGLGYIIDTFLYMLRTGYNGEISDYLMIPVFIAEFGFTGWLIMRAPQMAN